MTVCTCIFLLVSVGFETSMNLFVQTGVPLLDHYTFYDPALVKRSCCTKKSPVKRGEFSCSRIVGRIRVIRRFCVFDNMVSLM